ncbi:MAG TPA: hypothetical protein VF011_05440 [Terriglobales bacterium]
MRMRRFMLVIALFAIWVGVHGVTPAHAESTISCPAGEYDMLDWMTLDSNLRSSNHMSGSANPLFTEIAPGKFYWTKGSGGYPWDIQLYDSSYIYLWITEYAWSSPTTYKKFSYNTNMPLAPRCAKAGFPGSSIKVPNTAFDIHTSCTSYTRHTLGTAVNEVWGPYYMSFGGKLPNNLKTLVVSYRYNCSNYQSCHDKEEYYLVQQYGLAQWVHYTLNSGKYVQQQKSVFNNLTGGTTTPKFPCF